MLAVTSSLVWVQAPMASETAASATTRRTLRRRSTGCLVVMLTVLAGLVGNKAVGAAIIPPGFDATWNAVDAIDVAEPIRLTIRSSHKPVVRARQVLLGNRTDDKGRHQDHQFRIAV